MRLSDAMRKGCTIHPMQAFGAMFTSDGKACALAAGYKGAFPSNTISFYSPDWRVFHKAFPILGMRAACPACDKFPCDIETGIVHLNDDHSWTREAIADWIETLEMAAASEPTPESEMVPA